MVPIPWELRVKFVTGATLVVVTTFGWEHFLRQALPMRKPPRKGYEVYVKDLRRLRLASAQEKKRA
jgi:hypothetical protein